MCVPGPLQEVVVITELKGRGLRGPESQLKDKRVIRKPINYVVVGYLELYKQIKKTSDSCTWNSEKKMILVPGTLKKKNNKMILVPGTPSRLVRVLGAICS